MLRTSSQPCGRGQHFISYFWSVSWLSLPLLAMAGILAPEGFFLAHGRAGEPQIKPLPRLQWLAPEVKRWEKIEGVIPWSKSYSNPFDPEEVTVDVVVETPEGGQVVQPAFWLEDYDWKPSTSRGEPEWFYPKGRPEWRVRFTPTAPGRYTAVVRIKDRDGYTESPPAPFICVDAPGRGFLRIPTIDPRFFVFDDGTPFFAIGQNLAFIGSRDQYFTLSSAIEAFHKLAENGANYLRIWTCCEDWALCLEGRKSAWSRSWAWNPPWIDRPQDVPPPDLSVAAPFAGAVAGKVIPLTSQPLRPDPSHRVGVQPDQSYRLRLMVWSAEPGTTIGIRIWGREVHLSVPVGQVRRWTVLESRVKAPADTIWLGPLEIFLTNDKSPSPRAYLGELSLRDTDTERELLWEADLGRPLLGRYNPVDAFMLDQLVAAAEKEGLYLQLCLLTRDLYMSRMTDPGQPEYSRAIADAKRTIRYAIARWGYSTHVAAWEYWNEMNPNLPTDRFYEELGQYIHAVDPNRHFRTTSAWGPSPKDCRHPRLDIADVHYYLRPVDRNKIRDEVAAVLDRSAFLREHAPNKPALIAEFGLADDEWRQDEQMAQDTQLIHFHNALWASLMSGLSGTTLFWWWDQLDRMNAYPHYKPVAQFAKNIPFTREKLQPVRRQDQEQGLRVLGLVGETTASFWIIKDNATWLSRLRGDPLPQVSSADIILPNLQPGRYRLTWWDTWSGKPIKVVSEQPLRTASPVTTPEFPADIALVAERLGE